MLAVTASPANAATFTPGEGSGPGWCAQYGNSNGPSYSNVYACKTASSTGPTPFNNYGSHGTLSFQCTELANRFLWAVDKKNPIFGGSLVGGNFAQTVGSDDNLPTSTPSGGGVPATGDIISMWGGTSGQPMNGNNSHVAVVTGVSGNTINIIEQNTGRTNTITIGSTGWSYGGGHFTQFEWVKSGAGGTLQGVHGLSAVASPNGLVNVFAETSGGINRYLLSSTGEGSAVIATGSFLPGSIAAVAETNNNVDVFAETSGGINRYLLSSTGEGSAVIATGSFLPGSIAAVASPNGLVNVFAETSGGINRYLLSSTGEGSAVIATGGFVASGITADAEPNNNVDVFAETSGGINRYLVSSAGVGGAVVATGTFVQGSISADAEPSNNVDLFAATCGGINRYLLSPSGEGSAVIATGDFC